MTDNTYNQIDSYFSGEMTNSEKILFLAEIHSNPSLKEDFVEIQNMLGLLSFTSKPGDDQLASDKLAEFKRKLKRRKTRTLSFNILRYAAVFALIILSTLYISKSSSLIPNEKTYTQIESLAGQRVHMQLSDGSSVWLNARSKIKFSNTFNQKERVVLLDGEALFDVKKDHGRPFIVKTKRYHVKVLGTQFNVLDYADKDFFETTLIKGSVQVYKENKENNSIILSPNEQVVLTNNKLELYYDVDIKIADNVALDDLYTGKFKMEDSVQNILGAIQKTKKFEFSTAADNRTIYIR